MRFECGQGREIAVGLAQKAQNAGVLTLGRGRAKPLGEQTFKDARHVGKSRAVDAAQPLESGLLACGAGLFIILLVLDNRGRLRRTAERGACGNELGRVPRAFMRACREVDALFAQLLLKREAAGEKNGEGILIDRIKQHVKERRQMLAEGRGVRTRAVRVQIAPAFWEKLDFFALADLKQPLGEAPVENLGHELLVFGDGRKKPAALVLGQGCERKAHLVGRVGVARNKRLKA